MSFSDLVWGMFKPREKKMLAHLKLEGEITVYTSVKREISNPASTIRLLKRLTELGLIEPGPTGKRNRKPYTLTELGKRLMEEIP